MAASDDKNVYTIVDKDGNSDHFKRFAEYLGIDVEPTPTLIFMVEARKKYVADANDISSDSLKAFVDKVVSG